MLSSLQDNDDKKEVSLIALAGMDKTSSSSLGGTSLIGVPFKREKSQSPTLHATNIASYYVKLPRESVAFTDALLSAATLAFKAGNQKVGAA